MVAAVMAFAVAVAGPAAAKFESVVATPEETSASWRAYMSDERGAVPTVAFPYAECFARSAAAHDMPVTLLLAVARGESDFDPEAISEADAYGLMQIQWPGTAGDLGIDSLDRLVDPCTNVDGGTRYLKMLIERYGGDVHLALAAYNYGLGRIAPGATRIPDGASLYSGYIYNHLRYVLGRSAPEAEREAPARYADERRQTIQTFNDPARAEAFVAYLRDKVPEARLDWFDRRLGRWGVVLLYQDEAERARSVELLERAGARVPAPDEEQ